MIFKGYERIDTASVYDGLDSTSTTEALSARQGNVLNEKINNGKLVRKIVTQGENVITISDLDIVSDGGIYDIEIIGKLNANADVYMKINGISSGYYQNGHYTSTSNGSESVSTGAYTWAYRPNMTAWYCAHSMRTQLSTIKGELILSPWSNVQYNYQSRCCWTGMQIYSNFVGAMGGTITNITTISFEAAGTTFQPGTLIYIWRR